MKYWDMSWNPVTGCSKFNSACDNCYAEKMHNRLRAMGQYKYQHDFSEIVCHEGELKRQFKGKDKVIFVNSMSDLFHREVDCNFIRQVLDRIEDTPQHTFLICTKRIDRVEEFFGLTAKPIDNLWLGITARGEIDHPLIHHFKFIYRGHKWISFEPMLEKYYPHSSLCHYDWIVAGGETGCNARKIDLNYVMDLAITCYQSKIPFFYKQWGDNRNEEDLILNDQLMDYREYPKEWKK